MRWILLFISCTMVCVNASAQGTLKHRMYGGAFAGMQWQTISGVRGFQAEYFFFNKSHAGASVSVSHTIRYTHGNVMLFKGGDDYHSDATNIMLHSYFFPNRNWRKSTWFMEPAAGIVREHFFKPISVVNIAMAFEFGGGGIIEATPFMSIKLGMFFTSGPANGSIHSVRASIGF